MSADEGAPAGGGLRERNKRDKLARIVAAARDAFSRNGFEGTTLREVAVAANVGTGTLFLYARTKEDLLVLVFKRELEPVIAAGFENLPDGDLLTQLIHAFRTITEHHSRNLVLSRPFIKDVVFVSQAHVAEVTEFVTAWNDKVAKLVDLAKQRGEISAEIDSNSLAQCARNFFLSALRFWVAGLITREQFDKQLESSLKLLLMGLAPEKRSRAARPRLRRVRKGRRID